MEQVQSYMTQNWSLDDINYVSTNEQFGVFMSLPTRWTQYYTINICRQSTFCVLNQYSVLYAGLLLLTRTWNPQFAHEIFHRSCHCFLVFLTVDDTQSRGLMPKDNYDPKD